LEKGADINYIHPSKVSYTALFSAVQTPSPRLVQLLLDHGAAPAIRDTIPGHGNTPLQRAKVDISKENTAPQTQKKLKEIIGILEKQ